MLLIYIVITSSAIFNVNVTPNNNERLAEFSAITDSIQVERMIIYSANSLNTNPDSAIYWANLASDLARVNGFARQEALALNHLGIGYFEKTAYNKSLIAYNSALHLFKSLEDITGIFHSYINIGNVYQHKSELKNASDAYEKALDIAVKLDNDLFVAQSYDVLGILSHYKGDHAEALKYYLNAAKHYESINNNVKLAHVDNNIGIIYNEQEDYVNARKYYMKSINRLRAIGEESLLIDKLYNLSALNASIGEIENVIKPLMDAIQICEKQKNAPEKLNALLRINDAYIVIGNNKEALAYAKESLDLAKTFNNPAKLAEVYMKLASSYQKVGEYVTSLKYFRNAESIVNELDNYEIKYQLSYEIARVYEKLNRFDEALAYNYNALNIAKKIDVSERIYEATEALYLFYKENKEYNTALKYHELLMTYRDSINSEKSALEIGKIQAQYEAQQEKLKAETRQKQTENDSKLLLNRQKLLRNAFIISFLISLFIAVFLYHIYKRKSKANNMLRQKNKEISRQKKEMSLHKNQLAKMNLEIEVKKGKISEQNKKLSLTNKELKRLNEEKDNLIGIVAHDLRAPLNRSKGLAELVKMDGSLNIVQRKYIKMMINVCNEGIALTKDLLSMHKFEQSEVKLNKIPISVNAFFDQIVNGYQDKLNKKDLRLLYHPLKRDIQFLTDPIYLTRIIDNLLSNAIKFTFPGKHIYLKIANQNNELIICIKDEGQGISEEEQAHMFKKFYKLSSIPTAGEPSTGLGLSIVDNLLKKLGGNIHVESEVGVGTEIIITFDQLLHPKHAYNMPSRIKKYGKI